jgi:hypothetical protein
VEELNANRSDDVSTLAANLSPQLVADLNAKGHLIYGRVSDQPADWDSYRTDNVAGVVANAVPDYLRWSTDTS